MDVGAGRAGASIGWRGEEVVLHVLHDPLDDPGFYRKDNKDPSTPMADIAADMLQQFVADSLQERPDLTILGRALLRLVKGVPSNRILEVAADIEAQHIVLGRKGRSNLKELVVGSTTRAVTQKSPLPVTSLRAPVSEPVADISDGETE